MAGDRRENELRGKRLADTPVGKPDRCRSMRGSSCRTAPPVSSLGAEVRGVQTEIQQAHQRRDAHWKPKGQDGTSRTLTDGSYNITRNQAASFVGAGLGRNAGSTGLSK